MCIGLTYVFISAETVLITVDVAGGIKLTVVTVVVEHPKLLSHPVVTVVLSQTNDFRNFIIHCVQ